MIMVLMSIKREINSFAEIADLDTGTNPSKMSIWKKTSNQPNVEKIKNLYNENFPLEVRIMCAGWIEERIKAEQFIDMNDPQYEQRATIFLQNLVQQLEQEKQKLNKPDDISFKYRIESAIKMFTQNYRPVQTYNQIRDAIMYEERLLDACGVPNSQQMMTFGMDCDTEAMEIDEKLKQLQQAVHVNVMNGSQYKNEVDQYFIQYSEISKKITEVYNTQGVQTTPETIETIVEGYQRTICDMWKSIGERRISLLSNIKTVIEELSVVQKVVVHTRLGKWQRDQALSGNGAPLLLNALDQIQTWFEQLAELIWGTKSIIDKILKFKVSIPNQENVVQAFEAAYG